MAEDGGDAGADGNTDDGARDGTDGGTATAADGGTTKGADGGTSEAAGGGTAKGADGGATEDADGGTAKGADDDPSEDPDYGGLLGAIRFAYGSSDSRLMRSYVVVGTLLAALVAVLFVQALVVLLGRTIGVGGGAFTFSRAFFVVVALAVIGPLLGPTISTARRHRHGTADRGTDRRMAALGYLFVASLYLTLVTSTPAELQESVDGPLGPVVATLYGLPWYVGLVPPALVALAMWLVHRRAGSASRAGRAADA